MNHFKFILTSLILIPSFLMGSVKLEVKYSGIGPGDKEYERLTGLMTEVTERLESLLDMEEDAVYEFELEISQDAGWGTAESAPSQILLYPDGIGIPKFVRLGNGLLPLYAGSTRVNVGKIKINHEAFKTENFELGRLLIHEITHFLGFTSLLKQKREEISEKRKIVSMGFPNKYDLFVVGESGASVIRDTITVNPHSEGKRYYFKNPHTLSAEPVRLFVHAFQEEPISDFSHFYTDENRNDWDKHVMSWHFEPLTCPTCPDSPSKVSDINYSDYDTYVMESLGYKINNQHSWKARDEMMDSLLGTPLIPVYYKSNRNTSEDLKVKGVNMVRGEYCPKSPGFEYEFLGYLGRSTELILSGNEMKLNSDTSALVKLDLPQRESEIVESDFSHLGMGRFLKKHEYRAYFEGQDKEKRIVVEILKKNNE